MPDRKISQLTESTTPSIAAQIPIVESAANFRASVENLVTQVLATSTKLPPLQLHGVTHQAGGTDPVLVLWNDVLNKPVQFAPSQHASTHGVGGSDAIQIAASQVTNLVTDLAAKANVVHTHGNISSDGKIGTTASLPVVTGSGGVLQAGAFGSTSGTVCEGSDARLSNARTPTSHASTHGVAGSDPITLAQSQVTNLTTDLADKASTAALSAHEIDTTNVHGIADTSALVVTTDSRLTNARTPLSHAATHGSAGSDPITLAQSQVTNLTTDLAAKASTTALTAHELDTTGVHGIADTSALVVTTDARLSDARTPLPHAHGNIQNGGTIGVTANLPLITGASGIITTGTFGTTANTFCQGNDARLNPYQLPIASVSTLGGIKVGTNLTIAGDGTLSVSSSVGLGTVTSVGVSGGTTGLTTSGGPVTSSGTITLGGTLAVANGGTGATTQSTARSNLGLGTIATAAATDYVLRAGDTMTGTLFVSQASVEITRAVADNNSSYSLAIRGTSTGSGAGHSQMHVYGNGRANIWQTRFSDTNAPPQTVFRRMRGEQAAPAFVQSGDQIGQISFVTFKNTTPANFNPNVLGGANPATVARIRCDVTANYVSGNDGVDSVLYYWVSRASLQASDLFIMSPQGLFLQGPDETSRVVSIKNSTNSPPTDNFSVWRTRAAGAATAQFDFVYIQRGYGTAADGTAIPMGGFMLQQIGNTQPSTTGTDSQFRVITGAADLGPTKEVVAAEFNKNGQRTICADTQTLLPVFPCRGYARINAGASPISVLAQSNMVVTKTGTGQYSVSFVEAMPDTAYAVSVTASNNTSVSGTSVRISNVTTTGFNIRTVFWSVSTPSPVSGDNTFDSDNLNIFVFRK